MKKQLHSCCFAERPLIGATIYASLPAADPEPSVGDIYGVPEKFSPSGLAKVNDYSFIDMTDFGEDCSDAFKAARDLPGPDTFWGLYMSPIPEPDDPCDSDFMEEIST